VYPGRGHSIILVSSASALDAGGHHRVRGRPVERRHRRRLPDPHPAGRGGVPQRRRHPLAGIAAAYAGVSVGFAVNALITPLDSLLTEITNEAIHLVDPNKSIGFTANLRFNIASTFFVALVITVIVQKITEPQLGKYEGEDVVHADHEVPEGEARGLRFASDGLLVTIAGLVLLTVLPDAPLRNPETGAIFHNSPGWPDWSSSCC